MLFSGQNVGGGAKTSFLVAQERMACENAPTWDKAEAVAGRRGEKEEGRNANQLDHRHSAEVV